MDNDIFIPYSQIKKSYSISRTSLQKWETAGKLKAIRLPGGKRLYSKTSVNNCLGISSSPRKRFIYARVSSAHQKSDLERQSELLEKHYPNHTVIKDVGSGLNWKRKGFKALLEAIHSGICEEVVVTYKDRLCRFGYELVEWLAQKHNCTILVHNKDVDTQDGVFNGNDELADDLLAVVTFFTAKHHGSRSGRNKNQKGEKDCISPQSSTEGVV
jgi:predicted site-specific integrase-resolvase